MFLDLIILLGSATFVATLFHLVKLPPVLGFLSAGLLIGPSGLQWVSSVPDVEHMAEIAAILLMFTIGLEFSFEKLVKLRRSFFSFGFNQVALTLVAAASVARFGFQLPWAQSILIGYIVSLSSTAVVFKLLDENRDFSSPQGQVSLSVLLFQDMAVIPMLMTLPLLAGTTSGETMTSFGLKLITVVIGVIVLSKYIIPILLDRVAHTRSREVFFFCVLFICAGCAFIMQSLSLSLSLGAFIAGMIISESPYGKQAMSEFLPLRDNFLGLFFVTIGMLLDLQFLSENLLSVSALAVGIIGLKMFLIFFVVWFAGNPTSLAQISSLILFQIGEFSFILLEQSKRFDLLSTEQTQYLLAASILSLALTPIAYKLIPKLGYTERVTGFIPKVLRSLATDLRHNVSGTPINLEGGKSSLTGHTVIIGFGIAGQNVSRALQSLSIPYKIIEMNAQTVKTFEGREPIFFGDATQEHILEEADIEHAKLVIVAVSGVSVTERIMETLNRVRPDVKTIIRTHHVRDIANLKVNDGAELVVGEFETTIEILIRALRTYGVSSEKIQEFVTHANEHIDHMTADFPQKIARKMNLPKWELANSMRPVRIKDGDFAVNKSLNDLNIRHITGSSVVSVYRDGLGATHPSAEFIFNTGDIVYLIGGEDQMLLAEEYLHKSKS